MPSRTEWNHYKKTAGKQLPDWEMKMGNSLMCMGVLTMRFGWCLCPRYFADTFLINNGIGWQKKNKFTV